MCIKKFFISLLIGSFYLLTTAVANPELHLETWNTSSGTPVYYVSAPQIPMVDVLVAFDAGTDRDGAQPGLASLTANMLGQGTSTLSADQIADQLDSLGAVFNSAPSRDMNIVGFRSLTKADVLNSTLQLFIDTLTQANFPANAFARVKANTLQALTMQQQNPTAIAAINFYKNAFANSVYATPILGTTNTVSELTQANVVDFYKKYYTAKNAMITIVGAVTKVEATKIAEQITKALPAGEKAPALSVAQSNPGTSIQINFPANQTTILMGSVGIGYNNPDEFPLLVGNYILGGNMTSRLFNIVREKYGLTYSVGSYFMPNAYRGPFAILLQTKNDQVQTALNITKQVVNDYLKSGPTDAELKAAKDFLIGNFPLRIDNNADIANYVLTMGFYHLPLDYLDTYRDKVKAVTIDQIKTAMNKYVKPADFVTVTVGGVSVKPSAK